MKDSKQLKVCVLGLGYIGLPTAATLASRGIDVLGVDVKPEVVELVGQGRVHIIEPELDMLLHAAVHTHKLRAALAPEPADVFLIAVPTPLLDEHGTQGEIPRPCIDYVLQAARSIAPVVRPGNLVIVESTSPVGTTEEVGRVLREAGAPVDELHLAYCPERVLPGRVLHELVENDRVVGGIDEASSLAAKAFYKHFVNGKIYTTHCRVAEMVKLTENSFRDVNIAFANEISMVCDRLGIPAAELIRLANCHPRVNILTPGCGVGGHCIAVDPWFIVDSAPQEARIIRTAREVNDYKTLWVIERIKSEYRRLARELDKALPVVALCGLTFKPDIDDLRSSPALRIAEELARETDARFLFVEPHVASCGSLELTDYAEALEQADLIVRLVAHSAFGSGEPAARGGWLDFACR